MYSKRMERSLRAHFLMPCPALLCLPCPLTSRVFVHCAARVVFQLIESPFADTSLSQGQGQSEGSGSQGQIFGRILALVPLEKDKVSGGLMAQLCCDALCSVRVYFLMVSLAGCL
jgi:hypothetical protein